MENSSGIDLPPGFRFHPTDEELITDYLLIKSTDINFVSLAIGEADLRKLEPWEVPGKAKMGEEEWYVFCQTERRYPTGQRTNRGTNCGYWKATGKDKEIYCGKSLVGMRKTLVFYQGRAPKGVKSNWVMHEYRLDGIYSKSDWVISRVFHKNQSGKKTHISAIPAPISESGEFNSLPPLIETKPSSTSDNQQSSLSPWPYFSDHSEFPDSFYLIDDHGSGNDLLSTLKKEPWMDTGPGSSGYYGGGGGGYSGGVLSDDEVDANSYINY